MPKARAYFGESVEAHLQALWQQVANVNISAEMYGSDNRQDIEFSTKLEQDIWDMGLSKPERNAVGVAIQIAIDNLETELLPIA